MLSVLMTLLLSGTANVTPQDNAAALEIVPLQHVFGSSNSLAPPPWGTLLQFRSHDERPDLLHAGNEEPQFPLEAGIELLRSLFATDLESGLLHIQAAADNLVLAGDPALLAKVRDQVREAAEVLTRPLQIEVSVWEAGAGDPPGGMLDPREFAQRTTDKKLLWRGLAETRSGRPAAVDRQRWTHYLRDVDVEVAQKQSVGNPITDAFAEGGRVVVSPHALVGGDGLVVFVQFGFARKRGPVRSQSTGVPGLPDLELPLLETVYGACSGRIQNGGALAISMAGHPSSGGQVLLTVRVTGRTPPPAQAGARLAIFPCGALTSPALTQRMRPPSPYPHTGDEDEGNEPQEDGERGYLPAEVLLEIVRTSLGADADEGFSVEVGGGHMFVRGNERTVPKVEALLRGLQDRMLRAVTVRHSGLLAPADADPAASPPADRTALHDLAFPTMLGRYATVCRILETNIQRDLHVEIAQEASILNPHVEAMQSGSWIRVRAGSVGAAHHLDLAAQCAHAVPPRSRNFVPAGGNLMLGDVSSSRITHDGTVAKGQGVDHGEGPVVTVDDRLFRSSLVTVVTW